MYAFVDDSMRAHGLQWSWLINFSVVANKNTLFIMFVGWSGILKPVLPNSLCLQVAPVPRSRDLMISVPTTMTTERSKYNNVNIHVTIAISLVERKM